MEPNASALVTFGILAIALAVLTAVIAAIRASTPPDRRAQVSTIAVAGGLAWLALSGALAASGVLARFDARPPTMLLLLVPTLALPILLGVSKVGERLSRTFPLWMLVGFHAFRFPLELVMHAAAVEGTMPPQMSYGGSNLDIVTGASAVLVASLARFGRAPDALIVAWNLLGTLLLLTIIGVAVSSLPVFHAYGSAPEQLNTWVAYVPFVWLPAILVSSALLGHLVIWRRIFAARALG